MKVKLSHNYELPPIGGDMTQKFKKRLKRITTRMSQSATEDTIGLAGKVIGEGVVNLDIEVLGSHQEVINGKSITVIDKARLLAVGLASS